MFYKKSVKHPYHLKERLTVCHHQAVTGAPVQAATMTSLDFLLQLRMIWYKYFFYSDRSLHGWTEACQVEPPYLLNVGWRPKEGWGNQREKLWLQHFASAAQWAPAVDPSPLHSACSAPGGAVPHCSHGGCWVMLPEQEDGEKQIIISPDDKENSLFLCLRVCYFYSAPS